MLFKRSYELVHHRALTHWILEHFPSALVSLLRLLSSFREKTGQSECLMYTYIIPRVVYGVTCRDKW